MPSRIDLQAFLGEVDMFFLYPRQGRRLKKICSRLDTGRVSGGINGIKRIYMSLTAPAEPIIFIASTMHFLVVLIVIIVVVVCVSPKDK